MKTFMGVRIHEGNTEPADRFEAHAGSPTLVSAWPYDPASKWASTKAEKFWMGVAGQKLLRRPPPQGY